MTDRELDPDGGTWKPARWSQTWTDENNVTQTTISNIFSGKVVMQGLVSQITNTLLSQG